MSDLTVLKEVGLQVEKFSEEQLATLKTMSKEQLQTLKDLPLETFKKETLEKLSQFTPAALSAASQKLSTSPVAESAEALMVKFAAVKPQ